jgi:hypothetical protein
MALSVFRRYYRRGAAFALATRRPQAGPPCNGLLNKHIAAHHFAQPVCQ